MNYPPLSNGIHAKFKRITYPNCRPTSHFLMVLTPYSALNFLQLSPKSPPSEPSKLPKPHFDHLKTTSPSKITHLTSSPYAYQHLQVPPLQRRAAEPLRGFNRLSPKHTLYLFFYIHQVADDIAVLMLHLFFSKAAVLSVVVSWIAVADVGREA